MLLQAQLRRGLLSIRFAIVVVLSFSLVVIQWWTIRHAGYRLPYHQPTFLDETLLFSSYGSGTTLYQFLFPFLAALAGGSTLAVERRSGRLTFLQARSSYGVVERTSLCSGFLLGALGGVLPYVIDVLLAAGGNPHLSFIDGVESSDVDIASFQFILISANGWVYPIYRFNQVLCIVVVGLLMAALSGLFACLAVAISPFVRHRNVEVLVPVAFLLLWWMLPGIIQLSSISSHVEELNPILYLQLDGFETPGANIEPYWHRYDLGRFSGDSSRIVLAAKEAP